MTATISSELRKLRSIRGPYWMTLGLIGILLLIAYGGAHATGPDLRSGSSVSIIAFLQIPLPVVLPLSMIAFVVGTKLFTDDFQFGTFATTLIARPSRTVVAAAKTTVAAIAGAALGIVTIVVSTGVPLAWATVNRFSLTVPVQDVLQTGMGLVIVGALWAILGAGIAGVVKNQVAAPVMGVAWLMIIEGVVGGTWPNLLHRLPANAAVALAGLGEDGALPPVEAGLLLASYAIALAAAATALLHKRDVA